MQIALPLGFVFEDWLHRSARTTVVRALRLEDQRPVIIKSPAKSIPDAQEMASFRQESQWSNRLKPDSVDCLEAAGQIFLIRPDCGGQTLDRLTLGLPEWLRVLQELLRQLEVLHSLGVVHQEIQPRHLLWSEPSGLHLLGWSAASGRVTDPEGQRYFAPEQTGRLQRGVDGRTDLYGVGVTFWHCLGGNPPFAEIDDPLQLIHAILAQQLPSLRRLRSDLPDELLDLLEQLLSKHADSRPAHARAVLQALGGQRASPGSLWIGREQQLQHLEKRLQSAAWLGQQSVLVVGSTGVGKSALLEELSRRWVGRPGLRLGRSGYRSSSQEMAGQGLLAALDDVVGQLLAGPEAQWQEWSQRLERELGIYSDLLRLIVPSLRHCLPVGPPHRVEPESASVRLHMAVAALTRCLAGAECPLVVLLDDLHLADGDQLQLLKFLLSDPSVGGLLVVTTVAQEHLQEFAWAGSHEPLLPLTELEVKEWLESLGCLPSPEQLARIWRGSQGNPLLIQRLLGQLQGQWERLEVIDFQDHRLEQFSPATQECLALAAGLGDHFCLQDLVECGLEMRESNLPEAVALGWLKAVGDSSQFCFTHQPLRQLAYAQWPREKRMQQHLRWAQCLAARGPDWDLERVEQLRRGIAAMQSSQERHDFARLALAVSFRVSRTGGFERAYHLLQSARLCSEDAWEMDYGLRLALVHESNRLCLIMGEHARLLRGLDEIALHARSLQDEIPAWILQIRLWMARGNFLRAYEVAQEFLKRAGRPLQFSEGRLALGWSLLQTQWLLAGRSIDSLLQLPETRDPLLCAIQEVQSLAAMSQARASPSTIPLGILRDVRSVVLDGVTAAGAQSWTGYALLLCHGLGQFELARRYAQLAIQQVERLGRPDILPRVSCLAHHLVFAWGLGFHQLRQEMDLISQKALAWGDTVVGFLAQLISVTLDLALGRPLAETEDRVLSTQAALRHHGHRDGLKEVEALLQSVRSLRWGPLPEWTDELDLKSDLQNSATLYFRLQQALVFGLHRQALELVLAGKEVLSLPLVGGLTLLFWSYAGQALSRAVQAGLLSHQQAARDFDLAQRNLERWSRHLPARKWRLDWLAASRGSCQGAPFLQVIESFEIALQGARQQGICCDAALIAEEASAYSRSQQRTTLADDYQQQALALYRQWGAGFKAEQLSPPSSRPIASLDLETVLRACQALTGEVHLPALLRQLVNLALENAGGQRGLLLLQQERQWSLVVQAQAGEEPELLEVPLDLEAPLSMLPSSVLRYTVQTRQLVIVDDAFLNARFAHDPYLQEHRPGSLLCLPLQHGSSLVGLLYLEHALAPGSFHHERAEVVRTLSAQMAISLQNARHWQQVLAERDLRHQEALQRQLLESRKDALGAVLSIASHDLKNPLAVISMWMAQLGPDPGPERLLQVQRNVEAACHRASSLISTYLDVAALERGRMLELRRSELWLDGLIESELEFLLDSLTPELRAQAALQWELEPVRYYCDEDRLRQIISNLVGNALKHCPPGTPVFVTLKALPDGCQLEVVDRGPGLSLDLQSRLFLPFEREPSQVQGSGLGLWICRVIAEAHGGQIGVDSPWQGQGCRFWCRLP